jgi:hypothetical protein
MMLKDAPKNVMLIDPADGMKIKVLSDHGSEQVKIHVIDCGSYDGRNFVAGKSMIISKFISGYKIFEEPVQSKVSSATIAALETDIKNMEKNIESAKVNLEKAKKDLKKSIPALVVGGLYRIPENHHNYQSGTILVLEFVPDGFLKAVQFFDVKNEILLDSDLDLEELNDGTLIHLNSSEDKKFAKRLFELTKNY